MKTFIILVILSPLFYSQELVSQSKDSEIFNLLSLENKEVSVKINFDDRNDRLILDFNADEKMCILGARYLSQNIKILDKKFIELQIGVRGGSGESVHRYVLICISGDRLYKSVDVFSLVENLVDGSINSQVNFTGFRRNNNSYEISITGEATLQFDFNNKIFFNGFENLTGRYNVNSDKDLSNKKMNFNNEKFPSICVNFDEKYIFIEHKWYIEGSENHLMELTSNCN
jgi:hypothetical protein